MTALLHGIAADVPVVVDVGEPVVTTWGEFLTANADGIEAGDVDPEQIASALLRRPGYPAFGGGGASAEWSIGLLVGDAS